MSRRIPPESRVTVSHTLTTVFGAVSADPAWVPAVNCYQSAAAIHVCVELAGIDRQAIDVVVEPGRLIIRGQRLVPEPEDQPPERVLSMEIDHGGFERQITLPDDVDLQAVASTYRDGLLWIDLPLTS